MALETTDATHRYFVESILVVSTDDVSVLRPRENDTLTLVTCYPFGFIGGAPPRLIVRATKLQDATVPPASFVRTSETSNH